MPEQQSPGNASQLAAEINSKLGQFIQMVTESSVADEDDKQMGAQLIQMFNQFIDNLGAAPGQAPKGNDPQQGVVPAEAGAADVKPAL